MGSGPSRQKKKQSKIINARTEGHTDNKILQWDPWEGHLQEGNALKKDSNVRAAPEQADIVDLRAETNAIKLARDQGTAYRKSSESQTDARNNEMPNKRLPDKTDT